MPNPITSDELKEQLSIEEKLKKLAEERLVNKRTQKEFVKIISDIEKEILDSDTKKTQKQKDILNLQKEISKKGKEIEKLYDTQGVSVKKMRSEYEKFAELRKKELDLSKQIEGEERIKSIQANFNTLGLSRSINLLKQFNADWKLNPMIAIFGLSVELLKEFLEIFKEVDGAAADFRKNMGFLRGSTNDLEKNVRAAYFSLAHTGVTAKELYQSFEAISKVIGTSHAATIGMAKDMSLMAASLGVAQETSSEFFRAIGMMAKNTMDSQKDIIIFTSKLSEAAGTNLNEVMSDVANATKSSYQFMTRQPLALSKAAIEAKRMGTSLQDATKSAKTLVSFTESVKSEMEASVLLGESINLQRARELSYRKDLKGLNEEILRLAKETRFEDLDPFQQEAVANALGKSSDEIGKMLQSSREIDRIRGDQKLRKQVKAYDDLVAANEKLAKETANSSRVQLQLISNMEATKSISVALKSIFQSLIQPLVDLGVIVLPTVAKGLSKINQIVSGLHPVFKGLTGILMILGLAFGARGIGKVVSWAVGGVGKSVGNMFGGIARGVKFFGSPSVIKGAFGMLLVATSLIPLAFALKMMQGVEWKTLAIAGVALTGLVIAVGALGAIMASGVGTVAILAGAAALVLIGAALIPVAYAFQLFAKATKSLEEVNLDAIAGGLVAMIPPLLALSMMAPLFPVLSIGLGSFGLAAKLVGGPIERLGNASLELGIGLKLASEGLARMADLSIVNVISQFKSLSSTIKEMNKALAEMPEIKLEKLQNIIVRVGEIGVSQAEKSNEEIIKALQDIRTSIEILRTSLEKGGIMASVQLDSQKIDSSMARALAFKGTLSPQPNYIN